MLDNICEIHDCTPFLSKHIDGLNLLSFLLNNIKSRPLNKIQYIIANFINIINNPMFI